MGQQKAKPEDGSFRAEAGAASAGPAWWLTKVPLLVVLGMSGMFLYLARDLEVGSLTEPGPGLWPVLVAVVLAIMTLCGIGLSTADGIEQFGRDMWRVGVGVVALAMFVLLFDRVGLILPGVMLTVFWLRVLARESWRLSVAVGVGATLGCYLLFVTVLGVVFPDDILAQLWGGR